MLGYVVRRVLAVPVTLAAVVLATFLLGRLAPGDPIQAMVSANVPTEIVDQVRQHYGLDQPLPIQLGYYLRGLLQGDLGVSFTRKATPIGEQVRTAWLASTTLGLASLAVTAIGLPIGIWSAVYRTRWPERLVSGLLMLLASVPGFVLAYLLIRLLAVDLRWLPLNGWGTPAQAILPALSAGLAPMAFLSRVTRAVVAEALEQDYIRTATAKGLPPLVLLLRHALPNTTSPLLALVGPLAGRLLTGLLFVETIFNVPGIARLSVQAVIGRDYNLLQGCVLATAATFLLLNLLADLVYGILDPRLHSRA
jgi:ABC-type dipeptide/oligopeptide/nickel transport system permease component